MQLAAAEVLADFVFGDTEVEGVLPSGAELKALQRESLNKTLWLGISRKPCRPDLNRHAARVSGTTASSRIHQQIAEPPGAATIGQPHAKKPNFVAAAGGERGINFVQGLHRATAPIVSPTRAGITTLGSESGAGAFARVNFACR